MGVLEGVREQFGLDKPIIQRYFDWLFNRLRGDFGRSFPFHEDVVAPIIALTIAFVSHGLAVVRRVCDDAVVLISGAAVEPGPTAQLLDDPQHPDTRLLVDSIPRPGWKVLQPQG